MLQLDDFDSFNSTQVFDQLKGTDEPILEYRTEARKRFTFLDLCETSRFLRMMHKRKMERQIFVIPFHVRKTL